jgi:hypothetical protein
VLRPYLRRFAAVDASYMWMRFPRRRANNAGRSPDDQAAGAPPDDRTDWSKPRALGVRACCCPARPVVRVLIPPSTARPHSVALLLCGHHYRTSCGALAAAGAVITDDRRSAGTSVNEYEIGDLMPADTAPPSGTDIA